MTSFNEIPNHLKSNDRDTWTLEQALSWGGVAVIAAAVIIGAALYWLTYRAPAVTMSWLLSFVSTFFMTWMLFAIMHYVSGVIHSVGNTIVVVAMIAVITAKNFACLANAIDSSPAATGAWSASGFAALIFSDFPAWVALAFAAIACRNGEVSFEDLLGLFGRRH